MSTPDASDMFYKVQELLKFDAREAQKKDHDLGSKIHFAQREYFMTLLAERLAGDRVVGFYTQKLVGQCNLYEAYKANGITGDFALTEKQKTFESAVSKVLDNALGVQHEGV